MGRYREEIIISLLLVFTTLTVFWQVRNFDFVDYDDKAYITDNDHVKKGFTLESIKWAFTSTYHRHWHPLTWISHMLDYRLFGIDPAGHHLTSVFFHIVNTLLLFWFMNRMTGEHLKSGFVAALFALHPLHVEPVVWVADRKDVLSTLFWMLAMMAYVSYSRRSTLKRYLLVVLIFVMGLLSKPMVVSLPFVLFLLDYWPLKRTAFGPDNPDSNPNPPPIQSNGNKKTSTVNLIWEKVLFLILIGVSGILTIVVMQNPNVLAFNVTKWAPTAMQLANVPLHYTGYIIQMLFPFHLAIPARFISMPPVWKIIASLLVLSSATYFVFVKARRYPYLPVGWLWYLITLLPVVGIIRIGPRLMANHYTYIPLIGLFIIIAWGAPDLLGGWQYKRVALKLSSGAVIATIIVMSFIQAGYWKNSATLYRHALEVNSNHALAHNNLGIILSKQGKLKEAVYYFGQALRIRPDYANARSNLGVALARQGRFEDAIFHYAKALEIKPNDAEIHFNIARAFTRQGNFNMAITHYTQALRIRPRWGIGHNHLGIALARKGKFKEAIDHFSTAIEIDSGFSEAKKNLTIALRLSEKTAHTKNRP